MDLPTISKETGVRPRVVCKDGFNMSVQAGAFAYCTPRRDIGHGEKYLAVEVGFPSGEEEALMPYAEDSDRPCYTVYGYVPMDVVDAVIKAHGGLK